MEVEWEDLPAFSADLLEIRHPWRVDGLSKDDEARKIYANVSCGDGETLRCPKCAAETRLVYDHTVRHLRDRDWSGYQVILRISVPRIKCPEHGVVRIEVPWASRAKVRTTMNFEKEALELLKSCSRIDVSRKLGISQKQVERIQKDAVGRGMARRASAFATKIGVDETSFKKRHNYVTVVNDLKGRVLHVAPGKDADALNSYFEQFDEKTLDCLEWVTMDMSAAYISAVKENTKAAIVFDNFHVMMALNCAVDKVRRVENKAALAKGDESLKGAMHTLRRSRRNMSRKERIRVEGLKKASYQVGRAWQRVEWARQIMGLKRKKRKTYERHWKKWLLSARLSRIEPIRKVADTIENHLSGIVNANLTGLSNGHAESMNARIQKVKCRAHGYRNINNFCDAIYFHYGGLDMSFYT